MSTIVMIFMFQYDPLFEIQFIHLFYLGEFPLEIDLIILSETLDD